MKYGRTFAQRLLVSLASLASLFGCGGMNEELRVKAVTDRAAFDLSCKGVNVVKLSETSYGVVGCEKKASYVLVNCVDGQRESTCTVTMDATQRANGAADAPR